MASGEPVQMSSERPHGFSLELHSKEESDPPEPQREEREEVFECLPCDQVQDRRPEYESDHDEVGTGPEKEPGSWGDVGGRKRNSGAHESQRDQDEDRQQGIQELRYSLGG